MDGFKERLKHSIQLRLSLWLSVAILALAVVAGTFSFVLAYQEAHEAQDDVLRQVGLLLKQQRTALIEAGGVVDGDPESRLFIQQLAVASPRQVAASALPLPLTLTDGLQTVNLPRASYRVFVATLAEGRRIAVAQETEVRDELARVSAVRTVLPLLVLVPILLLLMTNLVRKMLQPVARLSAEIEGRGEQELHALGEQALPDEIRPFVLAINRLLGRVSRVLDSQRRFIADAAHELRSPLTALGLQAERLDGTDLSDTARERLTVLRRGIERIRVLLEQLLTFARVQSADVAPPGNISARLVLRRVLEDLLPLAEAKGIDIGIQGNGDATIEVSDIELGIVIKNLVENSIRYTPAGGRIDLGVTARGNRAILEIVDSGPGIAPADRERVFDPFYRVLGSEETGSGLGLAIVRAICTRIGAEVCFDYADESKQSGLRATVLLPVAQCSTSP